MNTKQLISEIKQRFDHNEAKLYLHEKYSNQLILAHSGGMWRIDANFLAQLNTFAENYSTIVLLDMYGNPLRITPSALLQLANNLYTTVMEKWETEYLSLKGKR